MVNSVNSNTEKKNFTGVQNYPDLDLHDGTKPMDAKYLFPDKYQLLMELWGIKNHGGIKGGINYFHYNNFVIFQYLEFNFESGLRTIYANLSRLRAAFFVSGIYASKA